MINSLGQYHITQLGAMMTDSDILMMHHMAMTLS